MRYTPITDRLARQARRLRAAGHNYRDIAFTLGANPYDLRLAITGETHTHITDPPPVVRPEPPYDSDIPRRIRIERKAYTRVSPEVREALRQEYVAGATGPELAAKYGLSNCAVYDAVEGLTPRRPYRRLTELEKREIRWAYAAGEPAAELADRFRTTDRTVHRIVKRGRAA